MVTIEKEIKNIVDIVKIVLINENLHDIGKKERLLMLKELNVLNVEILVVMFWIFIIKIQKKNPLR